VTLVNLTPHGGWVQVHDDALPYACVWARSVVEELTATQALSASRRNRRRVEPGRGAGVPAALHDAFAPPHAACSHAPLRRCDRPAPCL